VGNVGIGTTAPLARLHADVGSGGTSAIAGLIYGSTGAAAFTGPGGTNRIAATLVVASNYATASGAVLNVGTGTVDGALFVSASANVGIGTTSPNNLFQVHLAANQNVAISYLNSVAQIIAINDANTVYEPLYLDGSSVVLQQLSAGSVGIGRVPTYKLDVVGDVNCTGAFRVNGTPIAAGGGITTQAVAAPWVGVPTASRAINTTYHNTSGKPMLVSVALEMTSTMQAVAFTDAAASPTTQVCMSGYGGAGSTTFTLTFWVLTGNYYFIQATGGMVLHQWTEWT
jgi:hypothetical protein